MTDRDKAESEEMYAIARSGSGADSIMVQRLKDTLEGKFEMTDTDRRFYAHTLRVMVRLRAMGIPDDFIPKKNASLWNDVHTAALEDFKLGNDERLRYTDEAIEAAKRQEILAFEGGCGSKTSLAKLEQAVRNESVRDLLSVLAIGLAFPSIDMLFGRYRFEVIARGELCKTYEELFEEGILAEGDLAIAIKGPHWKAPKFVTEKKYER
ncbi:hypothetical protein [Pseudomonas sp. JL3]|uniref:hypothetical protein n=1 Tax=Pseudomonas sp. JL3 TaxID=2919943 RepID=UPI00286145EC|nr:hypothetical protein [Pseudomonas sp. JL3]MDR8366578.1 hypothetical protein [Pseudomonas sp. JL3]